jgi:hypothetical protein
VTNRAFCFWHAYYFSFSLIRAEQIDIDICTKIMQLHPDFRAFVRGLSQDDETDAFNRFLGLVII